tara:strand:+ start:1872 stop:2549 length:678 start_codon:yes stop_codon:yes gene_type:complete
MSHQKRLAAPKSMPLKRKETKYVTCQAPGPHKKVESVPINVLLRDMLGVVQTTKEAKRVLNAGKVLIDGVVRKDHKFPIGFLDEISIAGSKENYQIVYNNLGKLEIKKNEKSTLKLKKVIAKKVIKGNKVQINLFNGHNILVTNSKEYKVGDSIAVEKNKVVKHIKFEKGAKVFLTAGKHVGRNGIIEEIKEQKNWTQNQLVVVKTKEGSFEIPKNYTFVIDREL